MARSVGWHRVDRAQVASTPAENCQGQWERVLIEVIKYRPPILSR